VDPLDLMEKRAVMVLLGLKALLEVMASLVQQDPKDTQDLRSVETLVLFCGYYNVCSSS